jgi:hypothetical protein
MNDKPQRIQMLPSVALVGMVLIATLAVYFMRAHVRAARAINPGDSELTVHELLGEPDAVVDSIANLNDILPPTTSYAFRTLDRNPIDINTVEFERAEWFDLGSAGYLVIYDDNGVLQTLWGGT